MASERRKATVLVVDDEPDVVDSVRDLLRRDYRVLGASRASEGIRLLDTERVDVVMTDQRMPEMSGVELLGHARRRHPDATRLLFTGYADIRAVIDAINQGHVYRYITKPWDPDELQGVIREAVERHALLAERRSLVAELRDKNHQLELANLELQELDELKTSFIRIASHELRTPLTILVGVSHLVVDPQGDGRALARWLPHLARASDRLRRIVEQLVTMLVAQQYEAPLAIRPVSVAELLVDAAEDVRPFVEQRQQSLRCAPDRRLGAVNVDEEKIRSALDHLLLNAVKFTPDGGTIELAARREADGAVEISVTDDGVGIDPAWMPRLFQPFLTVEDSRHHASGRFEFGARGLGLGLSQVKLFVELHGGTVAATSEPGRGSRFVIRLPRAATADEGAPPVPPPAGAAQR